MHSLLSLLLLISFWKLGSLVTFQFDNQIHDDYTLAFPVLVLPYMNWLQSSPWENLIQEVDAIDLMQLYTDQKILKYPNVVKLSLSTPQQRIY